MRVLLTGATGFVGRQMLATLADTPGMAVRAAVRDAGAKLPPRTEIYTLGDFEHVRDWSTALHACDAVVHLAARVHVMHESAADPAAAFRRVNTDATLALARQATQAGVRRFVFLSSVKVNGESTAAGQSFSAQDPPRPADAYAVSKLEAELGLREMASHGALEVVIVRPPLVYGPRVRANFLSLLRWVDRELPLPLAAIRNRRSLVSVWNLCDLLGEVLVNPRASGGVWMVSDGDDLSTPELVRRMARAMNRSARLLAVPVSVLRAGATLAGRRAELARLSESLSVDTSRTRADLGWHPRVSVDEGLRRTAAWYLAEALS
jgi:UDP-N-acetyl-alpha-D-quinovosamine dehydrogenase